MPHIVKLAHPGAEHGPDSPPGQRLRKSWNGGANPHKRKFMRCSGNYVNSQNQLVEKADLLFWGEWEPPSNVEGPLNQPDELHPRWLHLPCLDQPANIPTGIAYRADHCAAPGGCSNTDPYIFDGAFKYLFCKQSSSAQLTNLELGSVVLFGSNKIADNGTWFFQLDTVFVVASYTAYTPATWEKDLGAVISDHYREVVLTPAFGDNNHEQTQYRLYQGATFENRVAGMYSFSPAKVCVRAPAGFPRVMLSSSIFPEAHTVGATRKLFTDSNNTTPRCTSVRDCDAAAEVWQAVRDACSSQGMIEGVRFKTPPIE